MGKASIRVSPPWLPRGCSAHPAGRVTGAVATRRGPCPPSLPPSPCCADSDLDFLTPLLLMGHGTSSSQGMSIKEQERVARRFEEPGALVTHPALLKP